MISYLGIFIPYGLSSLLDDVGVTKLFMITLYRQLKLEDYRGLKLSGKELFGKRWNYPQKVGIIRKNFCLRTIWELSGKNYKITQNFTGNLVFRRLVLRGKQSYSQFTI